MSGTVNKVLIVGNCTRDPEIRFTQSGQKIANLSVATNERWTDRQSGEKREKAEFHRVVIFDERLADVAEKYVKKGSKIYLEGSLQTRKWTGNDGVEKYTTEVVLQKFGGVLTMLDSPKNTTDDSGMYGGGGETPPPSGGLDDEIPF